MSGDGTVVVGTVGSLLAIIANSIQDALRTLMFADKRAWRSPEFEQLRLLEETLDEAKRDFQELPALVNGRLYYENDRKADSLDELHELCTRFKEHSQNFKNWVRAGGPIEPEWATETRWLRRELHRTQCRAVRRIHDDLEGSSMRPRCLGALIVRRSQQRQWPSTSQPKLPPGSHSHSHSYSHSRSHSHSAPQPPPPPQLSQHPRNGLPAITTTSTTTTTTTTTTHSDSILNNEIAACNSTGTFQRLGPGNRDIAFVCDFCDGFLVWEDLRSMPSTRQRASTSQADMQDSWAATGFAHPRSHHDDDHHHPHPNNYLAGGGQGQDSDVELEESSGGNNSHNGNPNFGGATMARATTMMRDADADADVERRGAEKTIVFSPVAVANHLPPEPGEWLAPLLCPLCDEYYYEEQGDDDMDRVRYTQDERGFESVAALQAHFEWTHAGLLPGLANVVAPKASSCAVM
ncbi:hypothetical protein SAMD00023353_8900190 [Rosellinia necatrix]|uniref:Uncharacterized protein n=1 Tax=Rosellinia necatrix TaxID=77044 RepID=A0A1W2TVS2_ROSNE|nr:hypothetical protein SAMD00023353_8900190 [Rosellinia necatrix]